MVTGSSTCVLPSGTETGALPVLEEGGKWSILDFGQFPLQLQMSDKLEKNCEFVFYQTFIYCQCNSNKNSMTV